MLWKNGDVETLRAVLLRPTGIFVHTYVGVQFSIALPDFAFHHISFFMMKKKK